MGKLLEANVEAFKKERPGFWERLKKIYDEKEYDYTGFERIETRDGNHTIAITREDTTVRLNSAYRPVQEAQKWASQYEFQNLEVVVVHFGFGNGVIVRELLHNLAEDGKVYVYEPDVSLFLYTMEHEDISDILLDNRLYLIMDKINQSDFMHELNAVTGWHTLATQIVCEHPNYGKLYKEQKEVFHQTVQRTNEIAVVNKNTVAFLSSHIVNNVLMNLKYIKDSNYIVDFIGKIPEDVPVIIVSAGPSLDKNIEELRRAKGKSFIIATDTAVKYLLKHNISFDAMVTLDAHKSSRHISDPRCAEVPLFCIADAQNAIMEFHQGRKIWFRNSTYLDKLYAKFGRVFPQFNIGGSVATGAFSISLALGLKKIILIGQDLALAGTSTHAGGVEFYDKNQQRDLIEVEGIDGGTVKSRFDWILYRDWFQDCVREDSSIELVDATEGGALIKGTKVMTLREAIDTYCQKDFCFGDLVENTLPTFDAEEYEKVRKECLHLETEFQEMYQRMMEAKRAANELIKMVNMNKTTPQKEAKLVKKLKKANKFVESCLANELLEIYVSDQLTRALQNVNRMTEDADQNFVDTLTSSCIVYEEMMKGIEELRPHLKEALGRI